jgi:hypothetical protein
MRALRWIRLLTYAIIAVIAFLVLRRVHIVPVSIAQTERVRLKSPQHGTVWPSLGEIERFRLSASLADFPVTQRYLIESVGLPKRAVPLGGSWSTRGEYQIFRLSDLEAEHGYYAVRIYYGAHEKDPNEIQILGVDVLFIAPDSTIFVAEQPQYLNEILSSLKQSMKERGLTPRDFAAEFLGLGEKRANQALLPTPTAVTPAASHPSRQP